MTVSKIITFALSIAGTCQAAAIEARNDASAPTTAWAWPSQYSWPWWSQAPGSSPASSTAATSATRTSSMTGVIGTNSVTLTSTGYNGTSGTTMTSASSSRAVSSMSMTGSITASTTVPSTSGDSAIYSLTSSISSNSTLPTPPANAIYKDASQSIEARVQDLLSRMTIEEKAAQMMQGDLSNWLDYITGAFNESGLIFNMASRAGQFYIYPNEWVNVTANIQVAQEYLRDNTRLGIPALVQTEGIHGLLGPNTTIFNSPIAYGCSFNRDLINQMATAIGQEASTFGVNMLFAPLGDLARELRYGRVEECFSEDSYLTGEVAYEYVRGIQSKNVSATVKHFAAVSKPEQGLNTGPVHGGERELRTTWLPSYKRAIIDAGAYAIMSAYSSYDGVPLANNHHILTDILRNEWGYQYWVTGDSGSLDRLFSPFGVCATGDADCVTLNALPAGNDVEMGGGTFNYRAIPSLVASGRLDQSIVDDAVSRQLRAKFALGLFEHPYTGVPESQWSSLVHTPATLDIARTLDRESIVLLQNPAQILPLSKTAKVAMIGPMADFMNYGDYLAYLSQYHGVTPLAGMQAAAADPSLVTFAQGAQRWSSDESMIPAAVAAANAADVAVVMVGTWSRDQNELWAGLNATTGEHVDVDDLSLVGAMRPLVEAIVQTGKPTVIVFSSGKPITESWISSTQASLVQQFYPSEEGGNALADILYGDESPSGRLSVSFPHFVGDLPIYYDYLGSGRQIGDSGYIGADGSLVFGHQYVLGTPNPWFPFGYGLSYTTFSYGNVTLDKVNVIASDVVTATVTVTNVGKVDSQEVVQLYVKDVLGSVDRPNKRLKGFWKGMIKAGETMSVSISVNVADVGLWNAAMQYVVEPGEFVAYMANSSADTSRSANFWVS